MRETVVIMGSHPRTRMEFDWSRTDCDLWLFNEALSLNVNTGGKKNAWALRADAVFQMHEETIWRNPGNRNDPEHVKWLESGNTPIIYMQKQFPSVPRSVEYPLDKIVGRFGFRYFTSSISYAIALACFLGYQRLELYGVEMESNTEYSYQREGVTLWLGVARGLGMEVDAHFKILDAPLYGYEGEVVLPDDTFSNAIALLQPQIEEAKAEYHAAAQNAKRALAAMLSGDNSKEVFPAVRKLAEAATRWGKLDGQMQENERYQGRADAMKKASEKFLFSRQEFESNFQKIGKQYQMLVDQTNHAGGKAESLLPDLLRAAKGSPKRQKLLNAYGAAIQAYIDTNRAAAIYEGAAHANHDYMAYLDVHIRAAGGAKSEAVILEALQNA